MKEGSLITKKIVTKSIDPQTAIRMFILENNSNIQYSKKNKRQDTIQEKYKLLSSEQKIYVAKFTSDSIKLKYLNHEKFTDQIYAYSILSSSEKKWEYTQRLIEYLFYDLNDDLFIKKICEVVFEIIDREFTIESNESTIIASCLALIIDIGIQISENKYQNKMNQRYLAYIIEYITSNLLARGNINNIEIRIALVYYLSRIEENKQLNLQKILSRFGQSLLEHIFYKYFSNSKNTQVAFSFLSEHLCKFLSGSAHLAEMGNSVLQNQMLKNPVEFLLFLEKYLNSIKANLTEMKTMTIHISFLLKKACEVNKSDLIEKLKEIILNHLTCIYIQSRDDFIEQSETVIEILAEAHSKNIRESIKLISNLYVENQKKIIYKNFQNKSKQKNFKTEENIQLSSPFEEILLLAK
jgi:hypothetical protein